MNLDTNALLRFQAAERAADVADEKAKSAQDAWLAASNVTNTARQDHAEAVIAHGAALDAEMAAKAPRGSKAYRAARAAYRRVHATERALMAAAAKSEIAAERADKAARAADRAHARQRAAWKAYVDARDATG
jgi:hypothetical protein